METMRFVQILYRATFVIALFAAPQSAEAASCETLKGEIVGFGELTTSGYAQRALDREVAGWERRYNRKAEPKDRRVTCKDYIRFLNEFECKAELVVCR